MVIFLKNNKQKVALIENHEEAYRIWSENCIRNLPVVHIDAHLDFDVSNKNNVNIGNFLYHAKKDKIVSDIYWIIPGNKNALKKNVILIKNIFSRLKNNNYDYRNKIKIEFIKNHIKVNILHANIHIYTLDILPIFTCPVLLDIDIDFFINNDLSKNSPLIDIGKKTQWIATNFFVGKIKKNIKNPLFTTISYSVNGGYTPMKYKSIGDQIAKKLGYSDYNLNKRIIAGNLFNQFRGFFKNRKITKAKKNFNLLLAMNPAYFSKYATYGFLFLKNNNLEEAYKEFVTMIKIYTQDYFSYLGLGILNIYKLKLKLARHYLLKAIKINKKFSEGFLYLAFIEFKLRNYTLASKYVTRYIKIYGKDIYSTYLLARLLDLNKKTKQAKIKYNETLQFFSPLLVPLGLDKTFL